MDSSQTNVEITNEETGDEFTFNAASLVSDVRDILLDHRRKQLEATVWGKLKESDQRAEINNMNNLAFMLIAKIVDVVATSNQVCAYVEVAKFAVDVEKGEVTITSKGAAGDDMLSKLAHAKGKQCRLTVLDSAQFNEERRDVDPEPDQPDLLGNDEEPSLPDDDDIVDPDTGEITTADAMADAIKDDPDATEEEKETLSSDSEDIIPETYDEPVNRQTKKSETADTSLSEPMPDPYQEGLQGAAASCGPDDCPYDGGTDGFMKWQEGRNKGLEDIEEITQEGREARTDGMAPTRCKWKKDTPQRAWWMIGYNQVKHSEAE